MIMKPTAVTDQTQPNNKIAIITDQHFDSRGGDPAYHAYFKEFYDDIFFPTLERLKIKHIIMGGDTIEHRKYINFYALREMNDYFVRLYDYEVNILAGNHDLYYKNDSEIFAIDLLYRERQNDSFQLHTEPETIYINGHAIDLMPWIHEGNMGEALEFLEKPKEARILIGHLELAGFEMYKGVHSPHGLPSELFKHYEQVYTGHYHHKSSTGNIHYLGAPYEITWNDYNDPRGFHILDLDTLDLEFIPNPYRMHYKIGYDDSKQDYTQVAVDIYKGKNVQLIVKNCTNPIMLDAFVKRLNKEGLYDFNLIDSRYQVSESDAQNFDIEDTLTLIHQNIDAVEGDVTTRKHLRAIATDLHVEANTFV